MITTSGVSQHTYEFKTGKRKEKKIVKKKYPKLLKSRVIIIITVFSSGW